MKAPGFWFRPPELFSTMLSPLGCVYALAGRVRRRLVPPLATAGAPLVVVGNVVAGGAGKTPVTLALAQMLQRGGLTVHLIAKGYGGRLPGPVRVEPGHHTAADVGDEPLLLAEVAPTWIARDRGVGWLAASAGADVVISDDGLQNPRLTPTLSLLVMDGVLGTGNGRLIPAGPLREPLAEALKRADAVVQVGGGEPGDWQGKPLLYADFMAQDTGWMQDARVMAFAGIGQPEKFFATCSTSGAIVVATKAFPDHHAFTEVELGHLMERAHADGAILVTTAKDAVRLPPAMRSKVRVVRGQMVWRNPEALAALLADRFPGYKPA